MKPRITGSRVTDVRRFRATTPADREQTETTWKRGEIGGKEIKPRVCTLLGSTKEVNEFGSSPLVLVVQVAVTPLRSGR